MGKVFCGVWRTEQSVELACRVDNDNNGRVVYRVVITVNTGFAKVDAESVSEFFGFCQAARYTYNPVPEMRCVSANYRRRISFRIHADQNNTRRCLDTICQHPGSRSGQHLQRCRANIRAIREAKEHQVPATLETVPRKRITILIQQ